MKMDIAIPCRLIWKTRPYIGQPWSSGRIPACQHGTYSRRIARALRSHVGYPRIWNSWRRMSSTLAHDSHTSSTQEVRDQPFDVESRDSSFRPWRPQTRTRNVVLTETPRFDVKQTRVRFPVVAHSTAPEHLAHIFCTRRSDAAPIHFMLCYIQRRRHVLHFVQSAIGFALAWLWRSCV